MNLHATHTKHQIGPRHGLALRDARGRVVTCLEGNVWLTMEGDRRDVMLIPGASFVVDREGLTLLASQRSSTVRVTAENQSRTWVDRLMDFLWTTYGPAALEQSRHWVKIYDRNR